MPPNRFCIATVLCLASMMMMMNRGVLSSSELEGDAFILENLELVDAINPKVEQEMPFLLENSLSWEVDSMEKEDNQREEELLSWQLVGSDLSSSSSCKDQVNCSTCIQHSMWCNWCDRDQACHAKGSYYGCLSSAKCPSEQDSNNLDGHCNSHNTCSECASSSSFCHWCAHDQKCHAVGSVYGCVTGVDCYSRDRCQRKQPEILHSIPAKVNHTPKGLLLTLFALLAACVTALFVHRQIQEQIHVLESPLDDEPPAALPGENYESTTRLPDEPDATTPLLSSAPKPENTQTGAENIEGITVVGGSSNDPMASITSDNHDHVQMTDVEEQHLESPPSMPPHRHYRLVWSFCNACTGYYLITLSVIAFLSFASIRYYPKMIEFSICNDSVAWTRLVESMAKRKAEADIEILASVANYNPINLYLEKGGGTFYHDGNMVGGFEIPPFLVQAMAISDVLIVAHFTTEKWKALKIGEEYYQGKLVLNIDAFGTVRIPILMNYTMQGTVQNMVVRVNEFSDRHLCGCPAWKHSNNILLSLPSIVAENNS